MSITEQEIVEALHERYWQKADGIVNLSKKEFKTAMLRSGLIKSISTVNARWDTMASAVGFHETNYPTKYRITLEDLRYYYDLKGVVRAERDSERDSDSENSEEAN